jgi:hypothetical protein
MSAPTTQPMTTATAPKAASWTELKIDPPREDGPQMGDPVEYWEGEDCPRNPFCGFVTLVGPNCRVSIGGLLPTLMSVHSVDGAIPADDLSAKGKWPKMYRYRPTRGHAKIRKMEVEIATLKRQIEELTLNFHGMFAKP